VTYSCAFCFRTRGCGCIGTRHSLRPLISEGAMIGENSGGKCVARRWSCARARVPGAVQRFFRGFAAEPGPIGRQHGPRISSATYNRAVRLRDHALSRSHVEWILSAAFPGCCAARHLWRGALLIRGPRRFGPGSAEQRQVALHRVRDTSV